MLSPEEIQRNSVVEIVSRETIVNNKLMVGGLFDSKMGVLEQGLYCPTDGLTYIDSPGYFGHIELAKPVFFIQHIKDIMKICKCVCNKCGKILINKNISIGMKKINVLEIMDELNQLEDFYVETIEFDNYSHIKCDFSIKNGLKIERRLTLPLSFLFKYPTKTETSVLYVISGKVNTSASRHIHIFENMRRGDWGGD
jgi:DNA-directed RNA polymerase beta' subunit